VRRNGDLRPGSLPVSRRALVRSLPVLDFLRPYVSAEAISGWFDDFAHSGYYDANGAIGRIMLTLNLFSLVGPGVPDFLNPLAPLQPVLEQAGLDFGNLRRCPGANERDPGDGSTPFTDNGTLDCDTSHVPLCP
jgi:phospholipid/cholesterol/gamma-HCH transport system substrate-binding protein